MPRGRDWVAGEQLAQVDNRDPFAPPVWRSPVYRTPEPVIMVVTDGEPGSDDERALLGYDHAVLGGHVLDAWKQGGPAGCGLEGVERVGQWRQRDTHQCLQIRGF